MVSAVAASFSACPGNAGPIDCGRLCLAKAGFTAFLSGLRNRLARRGVHMVAVKPGFVRTRMTDHLRLPPALTAEPDEVARAIVAAEALRRDSVYVRRVWRLIMAVIRAIPEPVFKRLRP